MTPSLNNMKSEARARAEEKFPDNYCERVSAITLRDQFFILLDQELDTLAEKMREKWTAPMAVNTWLRNVYGLSDDDTLNAGEVEELAEQLVYDILVRPTLLEASPKEE